MPNSGAYTSHRQILFCLGFYIHVIPLYGGCVGYLPPNSGLFNIMYIMRHTFSDFTVILCNYTANGTTTMLYYTVFMC